MMEFNLQTFPIDLSEWITEEGDEIEKLRKWFEGFEKQEKKRELELRTMPEVSVQQLRDKVRAYEKHLQQILGVDGENKK